MTDDKPCNVETDAWKKLVDTDLRRPPKPRNAADARAMAAIETLDEILAARDLPHNPEGPKSREDVR